MADHKGTRIIKTSRLKLRPFELCDSKDMFYNWAGDAEVAKYLPWQAHSDIGVSQKWIRECVGLYSKDDYYNWGIVLNTESPVIHETFRGSNENGGQVIGDIRVIEINDASESCVIEYCLSKRFWGRGIVTEAFTAVIAYLFDCCGFMRISANHDVNNPASGKVMEKCGLKFEGIKRCGSKTNTGEFCDLAQYVILKTDERTR